MSEPQEVCSVCGKPASHHVHDHKEAAPGKWETDGPILSFCAAHARGQRLTFASGAVFEGLNKIKGPDEAKPA